MLLIATKRIALALHRFGDRLGVAEVVLLSLGIGLDVFRQHQPGLVAERHTVPGKMMPADAGFHADQAGRQVRQPVGKLPARPFLPQHDRAALVQTDGVERILADVDADHGDLGQCIAGHGRAPSKAPLIQRASLVGQEHGRTIPLAAINVSSGKQLAAKKADAPE